MKEGSEKDKKNPQLLCFGNQYGFTVYRVFLQVFSTLGALFFSPEVKQFQKW